MGEGLQKEKEGLQKEKEGLQKEKEGLQKEKEDSREESEENDESFCTTAAALRSAFNTEAHLHCSLWNQQENLKVKWLETEDSLLGLKHSVDQLDSLLTHTDTLTS
ncbi:hypothetical protein PAMP_021690 [Pampus punctatissimus]